MTDQRAYWDGPGVAKTFTHPVDFSWLNGLATQARILDYGCGYGRVTALARQHGFADVVGVDASPGLIGRARREVPGATFRTLSDPPRLPCPDASFDAVFLLAVLTCIPDDEGQRELIAELRRVLRPGGLLYLSDLLLQDDERNVARYQKSVSGYGTYGVFEVGDGAVCRHHRADWFDELLTGFAVTRSRTISLATMNGNPGTGRQILATAS